MDKTTISISKTVKEKLEHLRGEKTWNEFLLELVEKVDRERRKNSARKFLEQFKLTKKEAEKIKELTRNGRKQWKFTSPKDLKL